MAYVLGLLAGLILPLQTGVNSRLQRRAGNALNAALISSLIGLVFLYLICLISGQSVAIPFGRLSTEPWWIWLGGACGMFFLTGNIVLMPKIGATQTVIFTITGQILMGLLVDSFGFFRSHAIPMTWLRALGAVLVIGGMVLSSLSKGDAVSKQTSNKSWKTWAWRLFGIIIGMLSATQTSINGYLGTATESSIQSTIISFWVCAILNAVFCVIVRLKDGKPEVEKKGPWWMWTGGIFGGLYVMISLYLATRLGTGLTVIIALIGSTLGGLIIDQFGLLHSEKRKMNWQEILGIVIMIGGTVMIRLL